MGPVPGDGVDEGPLAAGPFGVWLDDVEVTLREGGSSNVPCGRCTACCTSSQFVHISPDEVDALAHIPAELRFPAPRRPVGHVLMGYDEHGHCPMLVDGACSIYDHRPRTCRTYDCRVFPAAGLDPDPDDQPAIAAQVRRWRFDEDAADRVRHDAVEAAAAYVRAHRDALPEPLRPKTATQHAVLAIELHRAFLGLAAGAGSVVIEPTEAAVDELLQGLGGP